MKTNVNNSGTEQVAELMVEFARSKTNISHAVEDTELIFFESHLAT